MGTEDTRVKNNVPGVPGSIRDTGHTVTGERTTDPVEGSLPHTPREQEVPGQYNDDIASVDDREWHESFSCHAMSLFEKVVS